MGSYIIGDVNDWRRWMGRRRRWGWGLVVYTTKNNLKLLETWYGKGVDYVLKVIVLLNTSPGHIKNALQQIIEIVNVKEAFRVIGSYDIIAIIQSKSFSELRRIILKIRKIDYIDNCITLNVVDEK